MITVQFERVDEWKAEVAENPERLLDRVVRLTVQRRSEGMYAFASWWLVGTALSDGGILRLERCCGYGLAGRPGLDKSGEEANAFAEHLRAELTEFVIGLGLEVRPGVYKMLCD